LNSWDEAGEARWLSDQTRNAPPIFPAHNPYGQAFSPGRPTVLQECYLDDRGEDHPGARFYETNRDVKWICRALQRMEAQDLDFEARIRALEGWRAEKVGEERRLSTISAGCGGGDREGAQACGVREGGTRSLLPGQTGTLVQFRKP